MTIENKEATLDQVAETTETPTTQENESEKGLEESAKPAEKQIPLKSYLEEKRKRQELERKLEMAQSQDLDEDGQPQVQFEDQLFQAKVEITSEVLAEKYEDFDEKALAFSDLAKNDPALTQKFRNSRNPAKFAYDYIVKQSENDPAAMKERLKKEILDEINGVSEKKPVPQTSLAGTSSKTLPPSNGGGFSVLDFFDD